MTPRIAALFLRRHAYQGSWRRIHTAILRTYIAIERGDVFT
jgi:hypothetical protein